MGSFSWSYESPSSAAESGTRMNFSELENAQFLLSLSVHFTIKYNILNYLTTESRPTTTEVNNNVGEIYLLKLEQVSLLLKALFRKAVICAALHMHVQSGRICTC